MMKKLLLIISVFLTSWSFLNAQTLVMDVLEGHTDSWSTTKAGPWSYDVASGAFQQLKVSSFSDPDATWLIVGNAGAVHKGNIYYTFFGGEAFSDDDLAGLDNEYGYQNSKIVVRQWDDQTWKQVAEPVTYPVTSNLVFTDLTYDPNDDEVYCIVLSISGANDDAFSGYRFATLDLETMRTTIISQKDIYTEIRAIAAHPNGKLYAIDYSGYLYTISKQTGELTQVGYTGHRNQRRMQSMTADWRTGKLYFAGYMNDGSDHTRDGNRYGTALYEVNPETAALTRLFTFPNKEMVSGLYVQSDIVQKQYDLNVKMLTPSQIKAGETADFLLTVKNLGTDEATGYTVKLYAGDRLVQSVPGTALAAGKAETFTLAYTATVGDGSEVEFRAVVDYPADQNSVNNQTDAAPVTIVQSTLPTVSLQGMVEDGTIYLAWQAPRIGTPVTEDFERYSPFVVDDLGEWTALDLSGKRATVTMGSYEGTLSYPNAGRAFAWQVFNPSKAGLYPENYEADTCTYYCQSGSQMLMAAVGAVPADNTDGYELVQGNEWLISPELSGEAQTVSFYAKCWTSQVTQYQAAPDYRSYPEHFNVLYSTTDREPASFTALTAEPVQAAQWFLDGAYTYELPAGAKYFAIQRVSDPEEGFFLYIDDITYTPAAPHVIGYNVYSNGQKLNDEPLTVLDFSTQHDSTSASYGVSVVYEEGESALSNTFSVLGTGLSRVAASAASQRAFTLGGQRTLMNRPGIYVIRQNGTTRKVVVK